MAQMIQCKREGCTVAVELHTAWVPELRALRRALSGRLPRVADLKEHAYCGSCAHTGRKAGLKFYRHDATVVFLEDLRLRDAAKAKARFSRYF